MKRHDFQYQCNSIATQEWWQIFQVQHYCTTDKKYTYILIRHLKMDKLMYYFAQKKRFFWIESATWICKWYHNGWKCYESTWKEINEKKKRNTDANPHQVKKALNNNNNKSGKCLFNGRKTQAIHQKRNFATLLCNWIGLRKIDTVTTLNLCTPDWCSTLMTSCHE